MNVVIYRIPEGKSIIYPPNSFCPKCGHKLSPLDLIPVLSWVFLKGRCRYCKEPISARYPLVELLTGILYAAVFAASGITLKTALYLVLVSVLTAVSFIDVQHGIIPFEIVLTGFAFAALIQIASVVTGAAGRQEILQCVYGFLTAGGIMFALALTGGMGGGDAKLAALMGFVLGFKLVLFALFAAFVVGAFAAVIETLFFGRSMKSRIPFAPYLTLGGIAAMLFGQQVINMYAMMF
ncbi:leader peptidase (prepilin peptidase) / N-methyltransferase [Caldanaerobius fijiensis DSM 17918]|uniref:Leader peptidase (Prepilin peptidase) / N-methyltransferase n=1 Tax=Caldanaerobius fijiensis DSM 17918 TaxID=1121256 RepID=A0A1M5BJD1_9THEO|nr:leader peptidase (prepilin peptidase) / N-methyltransferase [Caldanaerobius fijiensis DSM 17918]